ncbi:Ankyrin repeat domain-containing protein 39 [Homalodisca vitripennis]|nr:Ankyrin repeat domain-containing protein 39 [Homalodisca vitripennis]
MSCIITVPPLCRSEPPVIMSEQYYIAVKASLYSTDSTVFGLDPVEISALSKRFPNSQTPVFNGVLIKGNPLQVINLLSELGYRVVCSSGESEIVWTLRRDVLISKQSSRNGVVKGGTPPL